MPPIRAGWRSGGAIGRENWGHFPMNKFAGVFPVVQTPYYADFSIDFKTLRREVDWLLECGAQGLVIGMVSEAQRLTDAERDTLHGKLVEFAAGRVPVVGSVGAESLPQALRHARAAEAAGVDAVMAIPPALIRCGPDQIFDYYRGIVESTRGPVIVQDASGYMGSAIPIAVQSRIYQAFGERVMFKPEAFPLGPNLTALRKAAGPGARMFEGSGGIAMVESHRRGVAGTMPGAEVPWAAVALWRALEEGNERRVAEIHPHLCTLIALMTGLDAFLALEKFLLVEQGIFRDARVRGPVGYEADRETLAEALRIYRLLRACC